MNIDTVIENKRADIRMIEQRIEWLIANRKKLESLELDDSQVCLTGPMIDFDNLTHDKVIKVILAFPAKWEKTPVSGFERIDYSAVVDGVPLRCWHGEPPPSCKIVEFEEDVPAQPATKRIVRKLVCKDAEAVTA